MENLVWWCFVILNGLSALVNIYDAGKGDYTKTNRATSSLFAGLLAAGLTIWGLLTLVS